MGDDIDLIKDDARVEDVEGRIIQGPREDNVLEKEEAIRVMNLLLNDGIVNRDGLVKTSRVAKEVSVVGFVNGEFWIICDKLIKGYRKVIDETYIRAFLAHHKNGHHLGCARTCCDRSSRLRNEL